MATTKLATTQLGTTGLEITRVGFGAWAIGAAAGSSVGARKRPLS
jgi:aryl-alcohol dehydrogenase-like predicted oxidoreductase